MMLIELSSSQSMGQNDMTLPTVTRLYFVREHRLHGIVTGLEGVKIMASIEDRLDRLVVSFKDAKVSRSPEDGAHR
jgi:cleavage and polyadenylation specificity factor subunit 1